MKNIALRAVESELMSRWPAQTVRIPTLDAVRELMVELGEPQRAYPSIHITGTNGKTTTARMIESLLQAVGLHTGRLTSPHVQMITERISLDGVPVSAEKFVEIYRRILPSVELVDEREQRALSFHRVMAGMAYATFADARVDVAVVEVGVGGRLDPTNVIDASVAVMTPIDLDHTDLLGDTPAEIATEKSGIVKPGATVVLARQLPAAESVILRRAARQQATVVREGAEFGVVSREPAAGGQRLTLRGLGGEYPDIFLPLHGSHMAQNAAVALAAVEAFMRASAASSSRELNNETVREAFGAVTSPGRLELIRTGPTVVLDAAHNPAGARATAAAVHEAFGSRQVIGVVAPSADKDVRGLLKSFEPVFRQVVVSRNSSPRSMDVDELAAIAVEIFGADRVLVEPRLAGALEKAVALAETGAQAGVLVTGSVVTVGEAKLLQGQQD